MKRSPIFSTLFALALFATGCATAAPQQTASIDPSQTVSVRCRDMLRVGSNQLVTVCGTEQQWAGYERRMSAASQSFTLRMQGSAYGSGF